jgi:hypothetical protein
MMDEVGEEGARSLDACRIADLRYRPGQAG